ncbi:MAG: GNAT family protein [Blastomonas sp.]
MDDRLAVALVEGSVRLEPFAEHHVEPLRAACARDTEIWQIYPYSMLGEHFDAVMARRPALDWVTLAVLQDGEVVGTTSYINPDPVNGVVEIGGTYIQPSVRGTGFNDVMKRLMIDHAFTCDYRRIEFRVDARNGRSQAAVLKLGATRERLLRRNRVTWTGYKRDTCVFGLLREEWKQPDPASES